MRHKLKILAMTALAAVILAATPALADRDHDNRGGRDWGHGRDRNWHDDNRGRGDDNRRYGHNGRWNDRGDWGRGRNDGRVYIYERPNIPHTRPGITVIESGDRTIIYKYQRNNGYYRPMSYYNPAPIRRYVVGAPLPYGISYQPIPVGLLHQLRPIPVGYEYVRVDNDVLLISAATRLVLDAVAYL